MNVQENNFTYGPTVQRSTDGGGELEKVEEMKKAQLKRAVARRK
jgi:hypothetical protein